MLEEPRALGPLRQAPVLVGGEARGDEVLGRARLVDGGDGGEAGASERPGAVYDLVEDGLQVEACADAQARRAERRDARAQRLVLGCRRFAVGHSILPAPAADRVAGPAGDRFAGGPRKGSGSFGSVRFPMDRVEIAKNSCLIRTKPRELALLSHITV